MKFVQQFLSRRVNVGQLKSTALLALGIAGFMHCTFASATDIQYQSTARDRADALRQARQSRLLSDVNTNPRAEAPQIQNEEPLKSTSEQNKALSLAGQMGGMAAMNSACSFKIKGKQSFEEIMQLGLKSSAQISNISVDILRARFESSRNDQAMMQRSTSLDCNTATLHAMEFISEVQEVIQATKKIK